MASTPDPHIAGLLAYLERPNERANEDLALGYFRSLFPTTFIRQSDAKLADGYVPGAFVLELKGRSSGWLAGLFQALAYRNEGLDFAQVVVAAQGFLAIWQVAELPARLVEEVAACSGAPNQVGRELARRHEGHRAELLRLATWNGSDIAAPLFREQPDLLRHRLSVLESLLKHGSRVRQRVTLHNFANVLREMMPFFAADRPVAAVRAFYSMIYAWTEASTVQISERSLDQATLGGEIITGLRPAARGAFKEFVENRYVDLGSGSLDDFFARYDEALDAVDPEFRRQHGIYFTDLHLSKFAMWLAKRHVPGLGENYLVLDPACGSGNLVTNWRSPLELRHKVVSEIEPELLFAVEQRMKLDQWHNGRFTVLPRVSECRGLNFLDRTAADYLSELREALAEKGHSPDKPLAILCNPPYRSDDDQAAGSVGYDVHHSIVELTGRDAASERYCCFLAQMKLLCETARSSGLPGESLLLLFTKSAWLTNRAIFRRIRREVAGTFEDVAGLLVDGSQFFDVRGKWPVAFTIWRYKGEAARLEPDRPVHVHDLTWLRRRDLASIAWEDASSVDASCQALLDDPRTTTTSLGRNLRPIRVWSEHTMTDFKRDRRRAEVGQAIVGGLPDGDRRRQNRKTYGEVDGAFVGFMDDLTPCRVRRGAVGKPWFRLNAQFMDVRKNRCFAGPPSHWGYCATNLESARKLFFWYSLARTLVQHGYPMWADAEDLWEPSIPSQHERRVFALSSAIVFAENECVETWFPGNNPVLGARETYVPNPLTPLEPASFWEAGIRPHIPPGASPAGDALIQAVDEVFHAWRTLLGPRRELPMRQRPTYFVDDRPLTKGAGILQIKDFAERESVQTLLQPLAVMRERLLEAKGEFFSLLTSEGGLNYFGRAATTPGVLDLPRRTPFQRTIARRLALAGTIVSSLHNDRHFGRTKFAKVFYLADRHVALDLKTDYAREAAGPLDQRALYHEKFGVEALGRRFELFGAAEHGRMVRYEPLQFINHADDLARRELGEQFETVAHIVDVCRPLTTDQAEIAATLYACWNDLIIDGANPSDDEIQREFRERWHPKKTRFSNARLERALAWMREHDIVPRGQGTKTSVKDRRKEAPPVGRP